VDRGRNGSKHHLLVDATGIPLAWKVTGGNRNDVTQLIPLVDAVPAVRGKVGRPRRRPERVTADRGYDHDKHRREPRRRGIASEIARRQTKHGSGLPLPDPSRRWKPFSARPHRPSAEIQKRSVRNRRPAVDPDNVRPVQGGQIERARLAEDVSKAARQMLLVLDRHGVPEHVLEEIVDTVEGRRAPGLEPGISESAHETSTASCDSVEPVDAAAAPSW